MNINATLFVQIINFWLTYTFLSHFLLRPLVTLLRKRAFVRRGLLNSLSKYETELKEKVTQKADALVSFKQHLKREYVFSGDGYPEVLVPILYKKNVADIKNVVDVSKEFFVKKVSHAYRD